MQCMYVVRETSLASLNRERESLYSGLTMLTSQKFLVAKVLASVRGIGKGKLLSLRVKERGHFFRAHFACLSKVVVSHTLPTTFQHPPTPLGAKTVPTGPQVK